MTHYKNYLPSGRDVAVLEKNSIPSQLSGLLDFVRWVAALLVVLQHVRYLWCVEYTNVQNKTLWIKLFYFITGFGSEAVLVFFMLSGYLVGGGALRKWRDGKYSSRDYFITNV
jgi:peptidoglycan/LPS O-acetylase OafA/YrhL